MFKKVLLILSAVILFAAGVLAQEGSAATAKETSVSRSDAAAKPAAFRPSKEQIKKGQEILIAQKLWDGEATGIYGECRPAIKAYQKANGLDQTGRFDKPTLAKMKIPLTDKQKADGSGSPSTGLKADSSGSHRIVGNTTVSNPSWTGSTDEPKRPAVFRANPEQIKSAQRILKDKKMYSGEESGKFDEAFRDGLGQYQEANKLKATRTLNPATLEKMGIALTDKQKENVAAQKAYDAAHKDSKNHDKESKDSGDTGDKD